jgi:hypothetical protein
MMEKLGMSLREAESTGDGIEVLYAVSSEEFFSRPAIK